jgi:GntR family transcriptional regulator
MKGVLNYVSAKQKIIQYIKGRALKAGDRLPTESELSEILEVGRLSLREAMNALKNEGVVHSVQGKGTFIACDFNYISDSLNINYSVTEMIELSGFKPGASYFQKNLIAADREIAGKLNIPPGSDVILCTRIRLADDTPVVFTEDYLSPRLAPEFLSVSDHNVSLYRFVEDQCLIEIKYSINEIIPVLADKKCSELLQVSEGSPLLKFLVTAYDTYGSPLIHAIEHFRPEKFKFIITRGR